MSRELWTAVDQYLDGLLNPADPVLEAAIERSRAAGLPEIAVTPSQGKLLHLLARLGKARNVLEIGTLGGYSTIWLGRALPEDGRLVTLEADAKHAEVARKNIESAELEGIVDLRLGSALDLLPELAAEGLEAFDLVFIDADKENISAYFAWALRLGHAGTTIVVDNVVREGEVADAESRDPVVQGVRRFNEMLAGEARVSATTIQTVGSKGYDGFTLALMNA